MVSTATRRWWGRETAWTDRVSLSVLLGPQDANGGEDEIAQGGVFTFGDPVVDPFP